MSAYLRVPADKAAREMVKGIMRRREEVVITGHGKVIVFIVRHFPRLFRLLISRFGLRARTEVAAS